MLSLMNPSRSQFETLIIIIAFQLLRSTVLRSHVASVGTLYGGPYMVTLTKSPNLQ